MADRGRPTRHAARRPFLLGPGGGGDPGPGLTPLFSRADVPAIAAQPTTDGRRISLGPVLSDGTILLEYGDYTTNTGPVDVVGWKPGVGVVTLYQGFDSERVEYRKFGDVVVGVSIDPKLNLRAHIVTNYGGTWHVRDVFVPGVGDAIHLFDSDLDANGVLRHCGSRAPDTAIVWATDDWTNYTEELAHDGIGTNGFSRFYSFGRNAGRPVVSTVDGSGDYVLDDGQWVNVPTLTRTAVAPRLGPNGERYETDGNTVYLVG